MLDRDPEGNIPAYEGRLFGGSGGDIMLRNHKFAVAPTASIETFGRNQEVAVVHSPIVPVNSLDTLESMFGGTVRIVRKTSFLGKKPECWFSLLNGLSGEDTTQNLLSMEESRLEAEVNIKAREQIESGESALMASIRATRVDMTQGALSKFWERMKGRMGRKMT